jgi:hypothetical protein
MRDRFGEEIDDNVAGQRQKRSHMRGGHDRPPRWEDVPAGTNPSICNGHTKAGGSCRAEVFWIVRPRIKNGRPIPGTSTRIAIDCDVTGGSRPDSWTPGRGVAHFATCVDADKF